MKSTPRDGDPSPVNLEMQSNRTEDSCTEARSLRRADWNIYKQNDAWKDRSVLDERPVAVLIADLYKRIEQAADAAIPKINNLYFPKPLWSLELNGTFNNRENL